MLNLGFFPELKGADSVLFHGAAADIAELLRRLEQFSVSSDPLFPIHSIASVSKRHPVRLYEFESIQPQLVALVGATSSAHQYFALVNSPVRLIVSRGEYGQEWWEMHE